MNIQVNNCNNIEKALVKIVKDKLNIKLAPNGTGKSTIARAIELAVTDVDKLETELLPFKYRENNQDDIKPELSGLDDLQSVMCFNEAYVSQFNFQQEELMVNSFDILIRNDEYKAIESEIEELVSDIRDLFYNNIELEQLISDLGELGSAFKLTKSGISQSSTGMKGLKNGNIIEHVPVGLESFMPLIQSDKSVSWISWQSQGCDFHEISNGCPFCTSDTTDKKELIEKVNKEYDKNTIKNLISIISVIDRLGDYFSDDAKEKLGIITNSKDGLETEHTVFLVTVKNQIDSFIEKLEKLKRLSSFHFEENENIEDRLKNFKLDLGFYFVLNSELMNNTINPINESLNQLIEKAGILKGKIVRQRKKIRALVESHQKDINEFLLYAGYKYEVEITGSTEESKLRLKHNDYSELLSGGDQHLSFGERNAFSIVLFMYDCLSKNPDLIILDDPISSFDKNKKYAILEMLFRRDSNKCLKNKTVLMLTHDVEPIIDTVKSLSKKFENLTSASFLKYKKGTIDDIQIRKKDIKTFPEICKLICDSDKDEITKLVYLRRNYEIINPICDGYQILSNLFHKRESDVATDNREERDDTVGYPLIDDDKFNDGCIEVKAYIGSFDYDCILNRLKDSNEIKSIYEISENGYEKLQLFRLLDVEGVNSVVKKFVNETYHVENEYVCQLNPSDFDTIPEYVIQECDNLVAAI